MIQATSSCVSAGEGECNTGAGEVERDSDVWPVLACWAVGGDTGVDSVLESGSKITLPFGREVGAMIEESNKNK